MNFEVIVQLKAEVLDPEGRAIHESLCRQGFASLKQVQVTKRYVLRIDQTDVDAAGTAGRIARDYLANPVAETFQIRKI